MSRCRTFTTRSSSPVPLRSAEQALEVASGVVSSPLAAETVCLLVDDAYLPLVCVVVEGGEAPDDVFPVAEWLHEVGRSTPVAHAVLVSCRPGHGAEADDLERWYELSAELEEGGVELIEWFVTDGLSLVAISPLVGDGSRWPAG